MSKFNKAKAQITIHGLLFFLTFNVSIVHSWSCYSRRSRHFIQRADRFSNPPDSNPTPSILEVGRPLLDAGKALEKAGSSVVSFSNNDKSVFDGGNQLLNAARDLEDAGALGRMRPGLFSDMGVLKVRSAGGALREAAKSLRIEFLDAAGRELEGCGEELGRYNQVTAGKALSLSGNHLVEASNAFRAGNSEDSTKNTFSNFPRAQKKSDWLPGATALAYKLFDSNPGWSSWEVAANDVREAGKSLQIAGEILSKCRASKKY